MPCAPSALGFGELIVLVNLDQKSLIQPVGGGLPSGRGQLSGIVLAMQGVSANAGPDGRARTC